MGVRFRHETGIGHSLEAVATDRARTLAPFITFAQIMAFVTSEPLGIRLSTTAIVWNVVMIPAMVALTVLLWSRRLAPRWGHALLAAGWVSGVGGTLVSQIHDTGPVLTVLFVVELACAAIMLDTRWTVACLLLADLVWIPLCIRAHGATAPGLVLVVLMAELFAVVQHRLIVRGLREADALRRVEATSARALKIQLAELQRSEHERARLQDQLLHSQRMEVAGTLAAGLAHDMNNVLGSITSLSELVAEQVRDASVRADVEHIRAQAERGAELTRGLLAFSRGGKYRKQVLALDGLVREVVPLLERTLVKTITVRTELAAGAHVEGDPAQLGQVLLNLGLNAADAMGTQGTLTIRTERVGERVRLRVIDTGSGMTEEVRRRVFEPFFTTKSRGRGTGLGLAIAWGVIDNHAGTIGCESALGAGTTFTIELPTTAAAVTASPSAEIAAQVPARRPSASTILVIDDEPAVREGTRRILENAGMRVITADNGVAGLSAFAGHEAEIALVMLDMGMPVMSGGECFARLRERSAVPVLISTGYAVEAEVQDMVARGALLIEKPYRAAELLGRIVQVLGDAADPALSGAA